MPSRTTKNSISRKLQVVEAELSRFLNRLPKKICGIPLARITGSARQVKVERLTNNDKVRLNNEEIVLDSRFVATSYHYSEERSRAACVLYFLHELLHVAQGIGAKATVRAMRSAGAEHTLLHYDLQTDHLAAKLLHRMEPTWSVAFLKDVQGYALTAFPTTRKHKEAAQRRKRLRMLSIRADYWARRLGLLQEDQHDGYLHIEYRQPRGLLLLFRVDSLRKRLGTTRLSQATVAKLERVAAPNAALPLSELDDLLVNILSRINRQMKA